MNKQELVNQVAKEADLPKTKAQAAVEAIFDSIKGTLKKAAKYVWLVLAHSALQNALLQRAVTRAQAKKSTFRLLNSRNSKPVKT